MPLPFLVAEYQNGDTSTNRSLFAVAVITPAGLLWLDIQYGIQPLTIRFGGLSAMAGVATLSAKRGARTKTVARHKKRELGEGTPHCAS